MNKLVKEILITSLYILAAVCVAFLLVRYVGIRTEVHGDSMNDTLYSGENLIVDKISYRFTEPERFDIIVFPYRHNVEIHYIKRIIGLPGETIQINIDGDIFIDDILLVESYGREIIREPGRTERKVTLGRDEYFVLGDNRNNSTDSRDAIVGNIRRDEIVGKVWVRIWPISEWGFVRHQ
ncbi:MAG: signal peptidase I [Lachnospiraceae bacterium]|jgi:signal peptidase I|nr:signal peptidase I [Lachnospiraceae bacterium]